MVSIAWQIEVRNEGQDLFLKILDRRHRVYVLSQNVDILLATEVPFGWYG